MSVMHLRFPFRSFVLFGTVTFVALSAGISLAQPPSDQAGEPATKRSVTGTLQKGESYVGEAVRNAQRVSRTDMGKAIQILNATVIRLESDPAIQTERRAALRRVLQDRIRILEGESLQRSTPAEEQLARQAEAAGLRAQEQDRQKTGETIKRLMEGIKKMRAEGRVGEASRQAGALAQQFPANPAVQADNRISSVINQLDSNKQLQTDRGRQVTGVLGEIEKSRALPNGDIEFPKDWKERTKSRGKRDSLTAKERAILRSLESTVSVKFKDTPLRDVLEYLQTYLGQPIIVDVAALKAAEIADDSPITINVRSLSVRTLLRRILADVGLTYTIHDDAIEVTTPQKARDITVVRVHYVGDLLGDIPELQLLRAAQLVDLIQTVVDPQSWRKNGGSGSIFYHPVTNSIVIKQGVENQSVISDSFR